MREANKDRKESQLYQHLGLNPGKNYAEFQHKNNTTLDAYLVYAKELKGAIKRFDVQGG